MLCIMLTTVRSSVAIERKEGKLHQNQTVQHVLHVPLYKNVSIMQDGIFQQHESGHIFPPFSSSLTSLTVSSSRFTSASRLAQPEELTATGAATATALHHPPPPFWSTHISTGKASATHNRNAAGNDSYSHPSTTPRKCSNWFVKGQPTGEELTIDEAVASGNH